jgi:opacity protein-like surface antigen
MLKSITIALLLVCTASLCAAQDPDDPKNELFAGYSLHSADINTLTIDPHRTSQNGVNVEYTRYITKNLGFTVDVSAHFHRETSAITSGTFSSQRDQYYVLAGPQYKRHSEDRVQPFVHALVGATIFHGLTTSATPAGTVFTTDDVNGFGMSLGGGLDIRVNKHFDVRLIQAEFTPTHLGPGWQNNFRISVGIIFKR